MTAPEQGVAEPVIVPGAAGVDVGVTARVFGADVPQTFEAVTVIFPALAFDVATMLVVVELPVHPTGNVQV